ncbi:MAG: threonine transporter RhtB [Pseudomonadales bacterium RIFCSPLOWO2_12_60_38]|jgi:homoserine/homoserine lactone efflux protein|uniref:Homoserine/homoserine lactone efflux protein n=12 Tax=Pseudomonas TaxID=286 RepID=A0A0D0RVV0_PSEFL|nr:MULTISPECIES: LysE family transporter [Pseudomonas]AFJ55990.1 homoserine/homoserine lactone efflux protein [Pseudomonas fluorescens A506]ETK42201.1 threonine transporter RhtB [Pseudomonas fluorescens FH5]MDN5420911.1 LysE family transporter [Pseudomonadales bacterium]OHC31295.1 MAG: threonine transporter RhtB [Pseudomonadales bacterium RIFCSPLOWO2_12_60_38]OHC42466.1 MAG: threonine transporter RhtB [Pseudomonadales bacterium RIFCSPLOWO2_12_FULL_59_450]PMZ68808.1 threonine transporter RhtB 
MALDTWLAFFLASWIISLSPGAGAIASMSSGLQYGFVRGYWNAIGLQLGLAMQIAVVAGGLGAILAASSTAFYAIKWFGVAYLVYLAIKQWRALPMDMTDDAAVRPIGKPMAMMFRGFLVNASNPKALVFMLAVLPQFVNPQAPLLIQYLILGATMISVDMIVMAGYTGLASKVLRLLRTPKQQKRVNRTFAGLFVGAAGFLASLHRATA